MSESDDRSTGSPSPDHALARRDALRLLLLGAGGVAAGAMTPRDVFAAVRQRSAAAPGVERGSARPPLAVQLYTLRTLLERDLEGTLDALAAIGIKEVEFASLHGRSPEAWRALLDARGMSAPAAHVAMPARDDGWVPLIAQARALGHRWLVIPWVGNDIRADRASWTAFARRLDDAGARLADAGLRIGYHNHDFEFTPMDGVLPHTLLVEHTQAAHVDFEIDLYWAVKSGQDPAALLAALGPRVPLWHVKDAGPPPQREMRDVGAGTIDFAALFALPASAALRHAFIEHDQPADPLATVRAGARALSR